MICQAKSPLATLPPASASRWGRGGRSGAERGAAGTRLRLGRCCERLAERGAKPFAGIALADSAIAFPTMSAAPVCCAVSAAALAAPPQPPLLPERRTTSRSWAVALGRQEESRAGEAEARCRQGQPLSGSRQVWHCTSVKSKLGPNNGWLLFFFPSLPF